MKILTKKFFDRSAVKVAEDLIGKYIVRKQSGKILRFQITETEAYDGPDDLASHASRGRRTKRTEVLFGEPGHFYIQLIYGMHYMINIVSDKKDYPAGVLIRGVKETEGPGRLSKMLKVGKGFNNKKADKKTGLWFEDGGEVVSLKEIKKTPRIGVEYAGPIWSKKLFRFVWNR